MKALIIYHSEHHGNTKKVADVIGQALGAKIVRSTDAGSLDIAGYDLIGFGSGVYYSKLHEILVSFVERLPEQREKKAFIFSTTGSKTYSMRAHEAFKDVLVRKGFQIIGEFSCLGFDTALSAEGINRGKPDAGDLKDAQRFAKGLANK
jgi:flavodoxin